MKVALKTTIQFNKKCSANSNMKIIKDQIWQSGSTNIKCAATCLLLSLYICPNNDHLIQFDCNYILHNIYIYIYIYIWLTFSGAKLQQREKCHIHNFVGFYYQRKTKDTLQGNIIEFFFQSEIIFFWLCLINIFFIILYF